MLKFVHLDGQERDQYGLICVVVFLGENIQLIQRAVRSYQAVKQNGMALQFAAEEVAAV